MLRKKQRKSEEILRNKECWDTRKKRNSKEVSRKQKKWWRGCQKETNKYWGGVKKERLCSISWTVLIKSGPISITAMCGNKAD